MKRLIFLFCVLVTFWLALGSAGPSGSVRAAGNEAGSDPVSPSTTAELNYSMTARIRLLLPWLNFRDVGMGRIIWTGTSKEVNEIELLIGSDPQYTPRKINRWGYLAERRVASSFELIGVMTQSDEKSVRQAKRNLENKGAVHIFKAIRTKVENGIARSVTHHISSETDFTIRDLEALLSLLPAAGGKARLLSMPPDAEPGFLLAMKRLIRESVGNFRHSGKAESAEGAHCLYVFNGELHELTLTTAHLKKDLKLDAVPYQSVIEGQFGTRKLGSRKAQKFKVSYGTRDPVSEVPLLIVYRPKWWFEAVLRTASPAVGG